MEQETKETPPCPICSATMRRERKQGIEIAVCADHGAWLDKGKIEALNRSVRDRTRGVDDIIRRGEKEESSEEGASAGVLIGWLGRLFH